MSRAKKAKPGRPSTGLSEVQISVKLPAALKQQADKAAKAEGIGATEWWRRAAVQRLETAK